LVVRSWLQINSFKIRQTSAKVAICRTLALARVAFAAAIAEKRARSSALNRISLYRDLLRRHDG
jgi:hypothetical protein